MELIDRFSLSNSLPARAGALIVGLLFTSSPATISRLVVAVHINAIEAMHRRRFGPHIIQKVLGTISPSFADGDAAATIRIKVPSFRAVAAIFHALPRDIFRSFRTPMSWMSYQASARTHPALPEIAALSNYATAARAFAIPSLARHKINSEQAAELLPREIKRKSPATGHFHAALICSGETK